MGSVPSWHRAWKPTMRSGFNIQLRRSLADSLVLWNETQIDVMLVIPDKGHGAGPGAVKGSDKSHRT